MTKPKKIKKPKSRYMVVHSSELELLESSAALSVLIALRSVTPIPRTTRHKVNLEVFLSPKEIGKICSVSVHMVKKALEELSSKGLITVGSKKDTYKLDSLGFTQYKTKEQKSKQKINYREYIKSEEWKEKRKEALKYYGKSCCICNKKTRLNVHHRHYKTLGKESMKDLSILCKGCHNINHEKFDIKKGFLVSLED